MPPAANGRPSAAIRCEPVPRTTDRLDRSPAVRPVELVAEMCHVDLDDIGVAFVVVVPDVLEDVPLAEDDAPVPQEVLEHGQLARGQRDLDLATPDPANRRVEPKVARLEHARPL